MKILLIGNFAPPFEEENLHNITLYNKLVDDGHECSVINISKNPSVDNRFITPDGYAGYLMTLLRCCRGKDVVHFSTKGYLRVGLLKMMLSIFAAKVFGAKAIVSFHSEFFSVLGQMRSPFGGTQTLFTSFYLADRIIYSDRDTFDVATMYRKKSNFELVPSFLYAPERSLESDTDLSTKLKNKNKVIFFANVMRPSFLFEIMMKLLASPLITEDMGIVIAPAGKSRDGIQRDINEAGRNIVDRLIVIEPDDFSSALTAASHSNVILRPLSCDGETFFERFTISARMTRHKEDMTHFPVGLVFVKEGSAEDVCTHIINTLLSRENAPQAFSITEDAYRKIIDIYNSK